MQPITSNNPLRIVFQQWINIFGDLRKAKSAREVLGYLFAPPGWQPDGKGPTTENLRRALTPSASNIVNTAEPTEVGLSVTPQAAVPSP